MIELPVLPLLNYGDSLVIATHNAGKMREIAEIVKAQGLQVQSAAAYGIAEPEETGSSFAANALLKAEHGTEYVTDFTVLADDSGLEIDALDGAPGIYSARWGGVTKDFNVAMARVKRELEERGAQPLGQPARFVCALALARKGYASEVFIGTVEGRLTFPARGEYGFGYDPIFVPEGYDVTFAEMDAAAKHAISHRANAFAKLLAYVEARRKAVL